MNAPSSTNKERRGSLLEIQEIQSWYELPSNFKVGLKHAGEFRMGAEYGQCLINDSAGEPWINLGFYSFYFPNWNAGGVQPAQWNNPLCISSDGTYLALNWLYAHRHSAMSPVLIHLPSRTYSLIEPKRILTVRGIEIVKEEPVLLSHELVWANSQRRELSDVKVSVPAELRPIEEFYALDPFDIDTDVYSWNEGVLSIEPLKNFSKATPETEKEREELKRDRCYPPHQRWQHIKDLMGWLARR